MAKHSLPMLHPLEARASGRAPTRKRAKGLARGSALGCWPRRGWWCSCCRPAKHGGEAHSPTSGCGADEAGQETVHRPSGLQQVDFRRPPLGCSRWEWCMGGRQEEREPDLGRHPWVKGRLPQRVDAPTRPGAALVPERHNVELAVLQSHVCGAGGVRLTLIVAPAPASGRQARPSRTRGRGRSEGGLALCSASHPQACTSWPSALARRCCFSLSQSFHRSGPPARPQHSPVAVSEVVTPLAAVQTAAVEFVPPERRPPD